MPTPKPQFLLVLHQPYNGDAVPPPEQLKVIMHEFGQWMARMKADDAVLGTNGLAPTGKVLRGKRGASATDGPYVEAKEVVGGYVLIQAENFDRAVEYARDCPGLNYNLAVEIRPVLERPGA
jgi:hypothetical protein